MENNSHNFRDQSSSTNSVSVPNFDTGKFKEDLLKETKQFTEQIAPYENREILTKIITLIEPVDFKEEAGSNGTNKVKIKRKHYLVSGIEAILEIAKQNGWGICKHNCFIYLYNGAHWSPVEREELEIFFGEALEKMGVNKFEARFYSFREQLTKQFLAVAYLGKPTNSNDVVQVNLKNGTFDISPEKQELRPHNPKDFITYQLPFAYNPNAKAPLFNKYLDQVLPNKDLQNILSEYLGYLFVKPSRLKLEKTLLLYGNGANGKSVFFEIVNALLGGDKNVSSYSLQSLTNENGYYRAMLANKLVNYASEINGKLESSLFKQLVSGEPVEARLPNKDPFTLVNYGKLIFNCNELPKEVEQSHAFYRRLLIVPFNITISEQDQDKELSKKITDNELSGVFNWVLDGLRRLLIQKGFTECDEVKNQIENYKLQSDNVRLFLLEDGYEKTVLSGLKLKEFFSLYRTYCNDNGYHSLSKKNFSDRLRKLGYVIERRNFGMIVFAIKSSKS